MISLGALPRRQWAVCENCESALRILWRHFGKTTSCAFLTYFLFPEPSEAMADSGMDRPYAAPAIASEGTGKSR